MSGDGTAEAAGRQDGPREDGSYEYPTGEFDRWVRMSDSDGTRPKIIASFSIGDARAVQRYGDRWWPHEVAVAKLTAPSPALGPSSPPPPPREEQIIKAAERIKDAMLDIGCIRTNVDYSREITTGAATVLRSCWPSAAETIVDAAREELAHFGLIKREMVEYVHDGGDFNWPEACVLIRRWREDSAALAAAREAQAAAERRAEEAERKAVGGWTAAHDALTSALGEPPEPGLDGVVAGIKELGERCDRFEVEKDESRATWKACDKAAHYWHEEAEKAKRALSDALRARPASLPPLPPAPPHTSWSALEELADDMLDTGRAAYGKDSLEIVSAFLALYRWVDHVSAASSPAPSDALYCPPPLFVNQNA